MSGSETLSESGIGGDGLAKGTELAVGVGPGGRR